MDLRAQIGPAKDQGRRGTCVAFAATAGHELVRGDGEELCVEFLHWAAKQRDALPIGAEGTTLAAAAAALGEVGQPPEHLWPYDDGRDPLGPGYAPPPAASVAAAARRLLGGTVLAVAAGAVRVALDAGRAVLLGVRLFDAWFLPGPEGVIAMPSAGSRPYGGHAVLLVGYQDGEGEGGGLFLVRNSWGTDWGEQGHGRLPYAYVDAHGLAAWNLAR